MPTPDKTAKNNRTLDMYVRLCEGKAINKIEEAQRYGVNARSIQRDIDDIRAFLDERTQEGLDHRTIEYDRARKGFVLEGEESALMNNSEILAVSKILLESRAFTKKEMNRILDKLVSGCVPQKNMKLVVDLLANERHHYVELNHRSQSEEVLWDLGAAVKNKYLIEMKYLRQSDKQSDGKRYVEPVAIIFSEYYFYLIGYLVEKPKEDCEPVAKYDYPAVFRVDRIESYQILKQHFQIPYRNRFEDGEFRKRVQFMYPGELMRLQFVYTGRSVEAVLDRLPTARIKKQEDHAYYIEAEVYGKGIKMWLLSQAEYVQVLKPVKLREEMKETLKKMLSLYDGIPE